MRTTIDKAGRVVIPAPLRERLGLSPGSELDVSLEDDFSLRLTRTAAPPQLVRVGKRLVVKATAPTDEIPNIDVGRLIDEERERWPI